MCKAPDTSLKLTKRFLAWSGRIIVTAVIAAVFVSLFVGDPNVDPYASISGQSDKQFLTAHIENHNILSLFPLLFIVTDPRIAIDFFTVLQKKGSDGSIYPCWINGEQNSATNTLRYGESVSTRFDLSQEESTLFNTELQHEYNALSYARISYSYKYSNRIASSEKSYSGTEVYMLNQEKNGAVYLVDMFANRNSPFDPTNRITHPNNLILTATVPGFFPLANTQESECKNYLTTTIINSLGSTL